MLQILDDGAITDAKGRAVNFKNTVIIMTSNIGSQDILDMNKSGEVGFDDKNKTDKNKEAKIREKIMGSLRDYFKPEFLNRIDETIIFHSLTQAQIAKIIDLQLERVYKRLEENKIKLEVTEEVKKHLVKTGYDPSYGARPLKRVIQTELLDKLSLLIISQKIKPGQTAKISLKNGGLSCDIK